MSLHCVIFLSDALHKKCALIQHQLKFGTNSTRIRTYTWSWITYKGVSKSFWTEGVMK